MPSFARRSIEGNDTWPFGLLDRMSPHPTSSVSMKRMLGRSAVHPDSTHRKVRASPIRTILIVTDTQPLFSLKAVEPTANDQPIAEGRALDIATDRAQPRRGGARMLPFV